MELKITNDDINKMFINHINNMGINTNGKSVSIRIKAGRKTGLNEAYIHICDQETKEVIPTPRVVEEEPLETEYEPPKPISKLFG